MKNIRQLVAFLLIGIILSVNSVSLADFYWEDDYISQDRADYIDVKISAPIKNHQEIRLESSGGFSIYYKSDKRVPVLEIKESNIRALIDDEGAIRLLDENDDMLFVMARENDYILEGNNYENNTIKIEEMKYRGYLNFKNLNGKIELVNHVDLEEYLYGLLPREMGASFPPEALKAQAVAARTYASYNMDQLGKHKANGYDLCDTTHCQVYGGYNAEKETTNNAVEATRGILALYGGSPINAQYHSSSSGYTYSSKDIWGGDYPYLTGVKDDFSLGASSGLWDLNISMEELDKKLGSHRNEIGELRSIGLGKVADNGNVGTVVLQGSLGSKEIKATELRTLIGTTVLKSTNFSFENSSSTSVGAGGETFLSRKVYVMDGERIIKTMDLKNAVVMSAKGKDKISSSTSRAIDINNREHDLDIRTEAPTSTGPSVSGDQIQIKGKGYGHGVGMSQHGAKKMAESGYNYEEILKFYYRGIEVK